MATKDRDRIRRLREEANQLRKQEEARKRRGRLFAQLGIILGALVVVGLVATLVIMGPRWFGNQITPDAEGEIVLTTSGGQDVEVPIKVDNEGVTVGNNDAPNTIDYYFDFSCPHCIEYHAEMDGHIRDVIASGEAKVTYHTIRYVAQYGQYAGAAMYSATVHDPSKFYEVVDAIFSVDARIQMGFQQSNYVDVVKSAGITDDQVAESVEKGEYSWFITDSTERARAAGIPGTPSLVVNGKRYDTLPTDMETLKQAMAGEEITAPTEPAESGAPDAR